MTRLRKLAERHLREDVAANWVKLFRPAAGLALTTNPRRMALLLGGEPVMPPDMEWPVFEGHGPLTFVASVDCSLLPELDIPMPAGGLLLFFHFDGRDEPWQSANRWRPEVRGAARVVYVPPGEPIEERPHPEGLFPYQEVGYAAKPIASAPGRGHFAMESLADYELALGDVVYKSTKAPRHQIGGFGNPVQDAPEVEAAAAVLGSWNAPGLRAEAAEWTMLVQIDSDRDMMWADAGRLYWLIRREDLAARRFEAAVCVLQTG
jgi:uncharacterized protein YwqG